MPTNIFARACVEVKFMSIPFSCIPSRNKAGGGLGGEKCCVGLWTANKDFGCITSHAQSTAATYFTVAVKSDVVYLIMVCSVLLLQLLELNRLATLGCRHAFFAHACGEVKFMSILLSCIPSRNKAGGGFGDEQCWALLCSVGRGFGGEQWWVILWTPNEVFCCITSHAQSTAAT